MGCKETLINILRHQHMEMNTRFFNKLTYNYGPQLGFSAETYETELNALKDMCKDYDILWTSSEKAGYQETGRMWISYFETLKWIEPKIKLMNETSNCSISKKIHRRELAFVMECIRHDCQNVTRWFFLEYKSFGNLHFVQSRQIYEIFAILFGIPRIPNKVEFMIQVHNAMVKILETGSGRKKVQTLSNLRLDMTMNPNFCFYYVQVLTEAHNCLDRIQFKLATTLKNKQSSTKKVGKTYKLARKDKSIFYYYCKPRVPEGLTDEAKVRHVIKDDMHDQMEKKLQFQNFSKDKTTKELHTFLVDYHAWLYFKRNYNWLTQWNNLVTHHKHKEELTACCSQALYKLCHRAAKYTAIVVEEYQKCISSIDPEAEENSPGMSCSPGAESEMAPDQASGAISEEVTKAILNAKIDELNDKLITK